jgi:tRNA pseudouridine38-40 synthase
LVGLRIALKIEYEGTNYCGWQRQDNGDSIQQRVEDALFGLTGRLVRLHGEGRTDAGVHALGQVAHFDIECGIPPDRFAYALNAGLPRDISVTESREAAPDFHARFSAKGKYYRYAIYDHPHRPALYGNFCMHVPQRLDAGAMRRGADCLPGRHDFVSFCAAGSGARDTVRSVTSVKITRQAPFLYIDLQGEGFLYNMVRIIAGTLVDVGLGRAPAGYLKEALEAGDRSAAGATAPACGLTLVKVLY